jgi:ferredoxin
MVIDLRKCIGCKSCVVICSEKNRVPPNRWRKVSPPAWKSVPPMLPSVDQMVWWASGTTGVQVVDIALFPVLTWLGAFSPRTSWVLN